MFALFCGYINIFFCSIKHIYFNQNYMCSVKQKNEKSIYDKRK